MTKLALKPDTFKKFVSYVSDNFLESKGKKLANGFIGELGRKYSVTNHGFTCTSYHITTCCWTSAMANKRNVTVEYHNGTFLSENKKVEWIFSDHN